MYWSTSKSDFRCTAYDDPNIAIFFVVELVILKLRMVVLFVVIVFIIRATTAEEQGRDLK